MFRNLVLCLTLLAFSVVAFSQAPLNLPQPNEKTYGVAQLYNYKVYNRATYETATGKQAPPFNPAKPVKTWFDLTTTAPTTDFTVLDTVKLVTLKLTLSKADVESVNLPGAYRYPTFIVRPTDCVTVVLNTPLPATSLNPMYLSTRQEAQDLADELGGVVQLATEPGGLMTSSAVSCPDTETRNVWQITFNGNSTFVGALLSKKYAFGIGHPGKWVKSTEDAPSWVPEKLDTGENATNYMRVPIRPLLANEKLSATPFGVYVNRSDLGGGEAGNFTVEDRSKLDEVLRLLRALSAR